MPLTLIGTKLIKAIPMSRLAYNQYRGWVMPGDEDGAEPGYLVEYDENGSKPNHANHRGYISWSPKVVVDQAYRETDGMSFGLAVEALKMGRRVTRPSWNGKHMWLVLVTPGNYDVGCKTIRYIHGDTPPLTLAPWIGMRTAQFVFTPWAPAQSDVLADDWQILEEAAVVEPSSESSTVRIPLKSGERCDLFGLIRQTGVELDMTDSIESVKGLRVIDHNGLEVIHRFTDIRRAEQRKLVIQGELSFCGALFSVIVDTETAIAQVVCDLAQDRSTELFVELEVKCTNHNRR